MHFYLVKYRLELTVDMIRQVGIFNNGIFNAGVVEVLYLNLRNHLHMYIIRLFVEVDGGE